MSTQFVYVDKFFVYTICICTNFKVCIRRQIFVYSRQKQIFVYTGLLGYGFNNLSDAKVKENIREADLAELQTIFDAATPKRYDRLDIARKDRLGFLAQDFELAGVTGKTRRGEQELLTLDYSRLTAVLWGVCKRLQARVEALENKGRKAKSRAGRPPSR